jgi:hypothetical protein
MDAVDPHRTPDVLDLLLAQILEGEVRLGVRPAIASGDVKHLWRGECPSLGHASRNSLSITIFVTVPIVIEHQPISAEARGKLRLWKRQTEARRQRIDRACADPTIQKAAVDFALKTSRRPAFGKLRGFR